MHFGYAFADDRACVSWRIGGVSGNWCVRHIRGSRRSRSICACGDECPMFAGSRLPSGFWAFRWTEQALFGRQLSVVVVTHVRTDS